MMAPITEQETDRRYFGAVEALVIDNVDPDGEGRVRVVFPWFDESTASDWCRVSQFYAGPNAAGTFFVPEINSEVLVAFIHGDMQKPIIIGSLYNGVDKPATARKENVDEKQIRTRTGHRITLVDTEGEEKIVVTDKSGSHSIEMSTADNSVTITSKGGKLVLAADEIEIRADSGLKVQANTLEESISQGRSTTAGRVETTAKGEMTLKGTHIYLN
jgi:uncharacterized protein involved in type VI secretion and phage assembly